MLQKLVLKMLLCLPVNPRYLHPVFQPAEICCRMQVDVTSLMCDDVQLAMTVLHDTGNIKCSTILVIAQHNAADPAQLYQGASCLHCRLGRCVSTK